MISLIKIVGEFTLCHMDFPAVIHEPCHVMSIQSVHEGDCRGPSFEFPIPD